MLDPLQFYCRVLCNGMKTRFRMVMIAHPGPGIGFHKRFMWRIIIPPTMVKVPTNGVNSDSNCQISNITLPTYLGKDGLSLRAQGTPLSACMCSYMACLY